MITLQFSFYSFHIVVACKPSTELSPLTHNSNLKGNEFELECPNSNTVVGTCNLDGAWEPSEPDCGKQLSTGTSVVTSTTQLSTAPPLAENQTRTKSTTTTSASSSTTNTADGGTYPGGDSEVSQFQCQHFIVELFTSFRLIKTTPNAVLTSNNL